MVADGISKQSLVTQITLLTVIFILTGCATKPPSQPQNICRIFEDKSKWYKKAKQSEKKWGSPISTMMAIMYQESGYRSKAKPPRKRILWLIPGPRLSDAYGYAQAKDATWDWYKEKSGNRGADRDKFGDAIDFIGWYNSVSKKQNGIALNDTYRLYLAYHEGHGGYRRGTYNKKDWLVKTARVVTQRAQTYQQQLNTCEKRFKSRGLRLWPF